MSATVAPSSLIVLFFCCVSCWLTEFKFVASVSALARSCVRDAASPGLFATSSKLDQKVESWLWMPESEGSLNNCWIEFIVDEAWSRLAIEPCDTAAWISRNWSRYRVTESTFTP